MIREKNSRSADLTEGKKMKLTILGAGAIGGICGAYLTRAGKEVTMVEPYKEHRERIREGVPVPINTTVREIIKKIEASQATPSSKNLSELEAAANGKDP